MTVHALSLSDATKAIIAKRRAHKQDRTGYKAATNVPTIKKRPTKKPPNIAGLDIEAQLMSPRLGPVGELRSRAADEIFQLRQALRDIAHCKREKSDWQWCRERAAKELDRSLS